MYYRGRIFYFFFIFFFFISTIFAQVTIVQQIRLNFDVWPRSSVGKALEQQRSGHAGPGSNPGLKFERTVDSFTLLSIKMEPLFLLYCFAHVYD